MKPLDPRLFRLVPAARRPVVVLAGVGVLQGVATIALAFALADLVVAVVGGHPLGPAALPLLALFAVRAGLGWTAERVQAWTGVRLALALRERLLASWLRRPLESRPDPDAAVTLAAQGAAATEPYAARFLPALVAGVVVPALSLVALLTVDWVSALIVLATLPLLPLFAALIGMATRDETDRRWQALASLSGHFLDVMRGLPTLVSFGRADRQVDTIREVSGRHRSATMRTLRIAFASSAALELLATISVAIVAVSVGLRLSGGGMTLSAGLTAILLAPEAYWPVRRVGAEFHAAADGAEAIDRILTDLDTDTTPDAVAAPRSEPAGPAGTGPAGPDGIRLGAVAVRGLRYRYPGAAREVLGGVDLQAGPGLTVLTGPSGVGKTTLLEVIAGLRTPSAGTVRAPRCHLVSQRPFLTVGTVRDALRLGTDADDSALWGALREVGLDGFVAGLPEGLATPLGDDGFGLSAGQRARLALARATLTDATVVLLDEPTAHLDEAACALAHAAITRLARTRAVLAVTHRSDLVALADQHAHLTAADTDADAEVRA